MIVFERRASTVLFNLLLSGPQEGTYLIPANVCPVVPLVFMKAKKAFEFIDISPSTLCMHEEVVLERWNRHPDRHAGLVFVRNYGSVQDVSSLFKQLKTLTPDALVVDDRCLCPPEFSPEPPKHTDVVLHSTGYGKYVDIGIGGYGVLNRDVPYRRVHEPHVPSAFEDLTVAYKAAVSSGTSFAYTDGPWLDTEPPSVGWDEYRNQVSTRLEEMTAHKAEINALYAESLPTSIQLGPEYQGWRFNIRLGDKHSALRAIRAEGLFASDHYAPLTGIFAPGTAPNAETLHREVLNLFNDRYFDLERAEKLVRVLLAQPGIIRRDE